MTHISEARNRIVTSCLTRRVTIVLGETGTGKSTYVPLWISESNPSFRIVCAQPRRVAATSIASRVASLFGEDVLGNSVGYKVRGEAVGDSSTKIMYATAGYLRTALSCDVSMLENFTHIILDEVHERSMDSDFLSLIVKLLLTDSERFGHIHLVVMSATIDCKVFEEYFAPLCRVGESVSVIEIPRSAQTRFTINTLYLEDLNEALDSRLAAPVLEEATIDLLCNLAVSRSQDRCSSLIFLPGEAEILAVEKRLTSQYIYASDLAVCLDHEDFESFDADLKNRDSVYYQIHILHSLVPSIEQRRALKAPLGRHGRHIVLATNIAESSLTVEAVNLVIDSGLKKELVYEEARGGMQTLKTQWTSRASLTQRRGRTGRVCDGTVIRLFTREMEKNLMTEFDVPEAVLASPSRVFLSAKFLGEKWKSHFPNLNCKPLALIKALISEKVSDRLTFTLDDLFAQGVLTGASEDSNLTLFGSLATWLQLEIPFAKMVFCAWLLRLPIEGVVLAAASAAEKDVFKHVSFKYFDKFFAAVESSLKFRTTYDMGMASEVLMYRNLLVSWFAMRALYGGGAEKNGDLIYSVPFYAKAVFPIEFQTFRNSCLLIARGFADWLSTISTSTTSSVDLKKIFDQLEGGDHSDVHAETVEKLSLFKSFLNDRKRCTHFYSDLGKIFLPMRDYAEVDTLKLILALSIPRALVASATFPRCSGNVFSLEVSHDVEAVTKMVCGGIEPLEIRAGKEKNVSLVFTGKHPEEENALNVPRGSEYASVTTNVAIRNALCLFEKSWKADLPNGLSVRKPYVYNICRWFLPAGPLDTEDTRVYLSPRNPAGWLETRKNAATEDPDYRRNWLANSYFALPARLVTSAASLVKAEMTTILPIRAGGRLGIAMILAGIPFRGSSIQNRLVRSEDRDCVEILNRLVPTRPEFPITPDLVQAIDKVRETVAQALASVDKDQIENFSVCLTQATQQMLRLANEDPVEVSREYEEPEVVSDDARVFELRMDAIMAEVEMHWDSKNERLSLARLDDLCSNIWDMYDSRL